MTLTLDVSRSNFEIAVSQELLVWLMWNEKEVSWYDTGPTVRHCLLTTPMTLTLEFQGQSLKLLYLRNGAADWHGMKRMWVIHSWPWYWLVWPWWGGRMYWIVNGVTSDVGVPSTYLVSNKSMNMAPSSPIHRRQCHFVDCQGTKDFTMRHDENYVEWNSISIKWHQFVTNWPYQTIYSKHNICSYNFLLRFPDSFAGRLRNQIQTMWLWKIDT